jgi:hypothetical protein
MKPLISIGDLMSFGFKAIKETWKPTLKYSVWFFLLPLAYYATLSITALGGSLTLGVAHGTIFWIVYFGGLIVMILGLVWATIAMFQYMIAYSGGADMKNWKPKQSPLSYLPGMLWIGILSSLPAFGTAFVVSLPIMLVRHSSVGATLSVVLGLISIPFLIWVGTLFSQAQILLLNNEARGIEAIKKSIALVQGRALPVFGRVFVPTFVMLLILMAIQMTLLFIGVILFVVLLGGWATFSGIAAHSNEGLAALRGANVGLGIVSIIVLFGYGVLAFVFSLATRIAQLIYQISVSAKLFHSLKDSK